MKHYLVTCPPRNHELLGQMSDLLRREHDLWAEEWDDGLFFVSSEIDAGTILNQLGRELEFSLLDPVYVIEIGSTFSAHGTTHVTNALAKRSEHLR